MTYIEKKSCIQILFPEHDLRDSWTAEEKLKLIGDISHYL